MISAVRSLPRIFIFALILLSASRSAFSASNNPIPQVVGPPVPQAVVPGSGAFMLTVYGANFVQGATVNWNRQPRSTTFISARELHAEILASDVANPTAGYVTVTNPPPGGRVSSSSYGLVEVHVPSATINVAKSHHYFRGGTYFLPLADFNNDGILDFVAQSGKKQLEARLGNGDGTFRFGSIVTHNSFSGSAIATGDFNNDENEDVVFGSNWQGPPAHIAVALGNGDGTFRKGTQFWSFQSYVQQIVVGDFNRDGNLDLITNPSKLEGEIGVFAGNGDGTFRHLKDYIIGASMVTADFNGDGILDLALFNSAGLYIMLGKGDGTFSKPRKLTTQHFSSGGCGFGPTMFVTDFNGDGKADLVFCDWSPTSGKIWVFLGKGDGTFTRSATLPIKSDGGFAFVPGDFNSDGKTDLLVNYKVTDHVTETDLYLGNGDGTFGSKNVIRLTGGTDNNAEQGIVPGDFNSDGLLDFIYQQPGDVVVFTQK